MDPENHPQPIKEPREPGAPHYNDIRMPSPAEGRGRSQMKPTQLWSKGLREPEAIRSQPHSEASPSRKPQVPKNCPTHYRPLPTLKKLNPPELTTPRRAGQHPRQNIQPCSGTPRHPHPGAGAPSKKRQDPGPAKHTNTHVHVHPHTETHTHP